MLDLSRLAYLPLTWPSFSFLAALFAALVFLIEIGALRYAYVRLGVSSRAALLLLLASLVSSYVNLPVAQLPGSRVLSGQEVSYYGMRYIVPVVVAWPGTVIAVNVGGAVIPGLLSIYLLVKNAMWVRAGLATAAIAALCHFLAHPIAGLGIAIPVFVPPLSAAVVALLLSPRRAAALAYISGSLGVLIGADLLNLDKIQGLDAPVASIGGAGTFDGIFLTGVLAVLIASFVGPRDNQEGGSLGHRRPVAS